MERQLQSELTRKEHDLIYIFDIDYHGKLKDDKDENISLIKNLSREMFHELNEVSLDINED